MAVLSELLAHLYVVCQFSLVLICIACLHAVTLPHLLIEHISSIISPVKYISIALDAPGICMEGYNSTAVF